MERARADEMVRDESDKIGRDGGRHCIIGVVMCCDIENRPSPIMCNVDVEH